MKINGRYLINEIELEEGNSSLGPQIIQCLAKSTTKYLILLEEHNLRTWIPFDRKVNILEEL